MSVTLFSQVKVSFVTTTTSSYCGGAAPPQEILNELYTPKLSRATLFIYSLVEEDSLKEKDVWKEGDIFLMPGKYLVTFGEELNKTELKYFIQTLNSDKLVHAGIINYNKIIIDVTKDILQTIKVNYHNYCAWELDPSIPPPP